MTHHDSFMDSKKTTLIRTHPTLNPIHSQSNVRYLAQKNVGVSVTSYLHSILDYYKYCTYNILLQNQLL